MNFGESVKEEIFGKNIKDEHCKKAFLAGLVRGNGVLFESESGDYGLSFKIAGETRAYRVTELIKEVFGFDVREMSVAEDRLNRRDLFEISLTGAEADRALKGLNVLEDAEGGRRILRQNHRKRVLFPFVFARAVRKRGQLHRAERHREC